MKNLLIGAVSGNYSPDNLSWWVETSNFDGVERVLLLYNNNDDLLSDYLIKNNIRVLNPDFGFLAEYNSFFETNAGNNTLENSYNLIHNIRFFHIWNYLNNTESIYDKVIITDVRDVYFNDNPFNDLEDNKLTATSELVIYQNESWNKEHLCVNLGLIGYSLLIDKPVYNVGVFGGNINLVRDICADIYLLSVGKHKVADQTSFNYLIQTRYKEVTNFTENLAIHLHVVNAGLVDISLNKIPNYKIVHQYDRIPGYKR
jgi:hypothetical protein